MCPSRYHQRSNLLSTHVRSNFHYPWVWTKTNPNPTKPNKMEPSGEFTACQLEIQYDGHQQGFERSPKWGNLMTVPFLYTVFKEHGLKNKQVKRQKNRCSGGKMDLKEQAPNGFREAVSYSSSKSFYFFLEFYEYTESVYWWFLRNIFPCTIDDFFHNIIDSFVASPFLKGGSTLLHLGDPTDSSVQRI